MADFLISANYTAPAQPTWSCPPSLNVNWEVVRSDSISAGERVSIATNGIDEVISLLSLLFHLFIKLFYLVYY